MKRNSLCPCGSGKKYKRCCGANQSESQLIDLTAGLRMKGGVRFDPVTDRYIVIVHTWDNVHCQGEPKEWRSSEIFSTEEEAMSYYKASIRPALERMMAKITRKKSGTTFVHRKLE